MEESVYSTLKNNGIVEGSLVVSTAGHDEGIVYLVISCNNKMTLLVNGINRKFENPKKKRIKHIKPIVFPKNPKDLINKLNNIQNENEKDIETRKIIDNLLSKNHEGGVENV